MSWTNTPLPSLLQSELDSFSLSFTAGEDFFSDCVQIANGFYNFARAQEQLLNALIDRAGILDDLPEVGSPVYNALGDEKAMIDELAPLIVRACNGTKSLDEQVLADQAALDRLIVTTQSKYDPQGVLDNLNLPLPGNRKLLR